MRHRLVTTFHADSESVTTDDVVQMLLERVPVALQARAAETAMG